MSETQVIKTPGPLGRFLALPNDSNVKTIGMALLVCLVCSLAVSVTVTVLKDIQMRNRAPGLKENILAVAGLLHRGANINRAFEQVEARVVDLKTGEYADDIDPATYDQRDAIKDRSRSNPISRENDIAGIKRRARYATVYLIREEDRIKRLVLPVYGQGFLSTMYGFIALEDDAGTVHGLKFYDHRETPGLGGEVDDPGWLGQWRGKRIYNEAGQVAIEVVHGRVEARSIIKEYQVDGLSGATMTGNGVTNILRFWLGDIGFRPYLEKNFMSTN